MTDTQLLQQTLDDAAELLCGCSSDDQRQWIVYLLEALEGKDYDKSPSRYSTKILLPLRADIRDRLEAGRW